VILREASGAPEHKPEGSTHVDEHAMLQLGCSRWPLARKAGKGLLG
jgi:hypothetical protein